MVTAPVLSTTTLKIDSTKIVSDKGNGVRKFCGDYQFRIKQKAESTASFAANTMTNWDKIKLPYWVTPCKEAIPRTTWNEFHSQDFDPIAQVSCGKGHSYYPAEIKPRKFHCDP